MSEEEKTISRGTTSYWHFYPQVRLKPSEIKFPRYEKVGDLIITSDWVDIPFEVGAGPGIVPIGELKHSMHLDFFGAQALRFWFLSNLRDIGSYGLETRIKRFRTEITHKTFERGDFDEGDWQTLTGETHK